MNDHTDNLACLTGQKNPDLVEIDGVSLHRCTLPDWRALQNSARAAGFELSAVSAYRSFSRQLKIWNDKARGVRPVLDAHGEVLDVSAMSDDECLFSILRWSALPGASRHHWGTDVDVVDSASMPAGYSVQLTDAEVYNDGPFAALHDWLDSIINNDHSYGFYRPYAAKLDAGADRAQRLAEPSVGGPAHSAPGDSFKVMGIAPELWHLSHRPSSRHFKACLNCDTLHAFYARQSEMALQGAILDNFEAIYAGYIDV
jgi:hypothetical protein